jgi:hypothetical protein
VQSAHDPGGDAALEPERVADRDDRVPDAQPIGISEVQRRQGPRFDVDLEDGEIGRRILADEPGRDAVAVREADLDLLSPLNHMSVRDDVAGLVDHEPGAERLLFLFLREAEGVEERVGRDFLNARRRDLHDAGSALPVDLVDALPVRLLERGRCGRLRPLDHLDRVGLVVEDACDLGTRQRNPAAHHCCDEQRGRATQCAGRSQHMTSSNNLFVASGLPRINRRLRSVQRRRAEAARLRAAARSSKKLRPRSAGPRARSARSRSS